MTGVEQGVIILRQTLELSSVHFEHKWISHFVEKKRQTLYLKLWNFGALVTQLTVRQACSKWRSEKGGKIASRNLGEANIFNGPFCLNFFIKQERTQISYWKRKINPWKWIALDSTTFYLDFRYEIKFGYVLRSGIKRKLSLFVCTM